VLGESQRLLVLDHGAQLGDFESGHVLGEHAQQGRPDAAPAMTG
jgi:hypothetical protein